MLRNINHKEILKTDIEKDKKGERGGKNINMEWRKGNVNRKMRQEGRNCKERETKEKRQNVKWIYIYQTKNLI